MSVSWQNRRRTLSHPNTLLADSSSVKASPHCRRKVRQSHFSATVWTGLYAVELARKANSSLIHYLKLAENFRISEFKSSMNPELTEIQPGQHHRPL